jgi:hypothetical protein
VYLPVDNFACAPLFPSFFVILETFIPYSRLSEYLMKRADLSRSHGSHAEEYQLEQLQRELEDILDALDAIAQEADERDALRRAGLNA